MADSQNPNEEHAKQAILASAAVSLALAELLIEKGVITAEEFDQRRLAMVAGLDQTLARVHDENEGPDAERTEDAE